MKATITNIVIGLLLAACATAFSLVIFESCFRLYLLAQNWNRGSVESQLVRSEVNEPEELEGKTTLRGLVRASPFEKIVYELKPNLRGRFQGTELRTNSFGMRDHEYEIVKAPNTVRIIGLGDSVMFGWGVKEEETYLGRLEQSLNEESQGKQLFEVLNFAVPGYNTAMEVATLEHRALPFHPDIIVIHFVKNDYDVPLFMREQINPLAFDRSFLLEFLQARFGAGQKTGELLNASLSSLPRSKRGKVLEQYRDISGARGFKQAITRLGELSQEKNIPVILIVGNVSGKNRRRLEAVSSKFGFQLLDVRDHVRAYLKQNNLPDTKETRRKLFWVTPSDAHPSPLGHQLFAEALLEKIETILR